MADDIVAAIPARNVQFFTPAADGTAIDRLDAIRADLLENGAHLLSERVYIWRDGPWQVIGR